jgi:hypothetical protein
MEIKSIFHRSDEKSETKISLGRQRRKVCREYLCYEGIKFILCGAFSLELKQIRIGPVIEAGQRQMPGEIKYKQLRQEKVPPSLRSVIEKYNPENAYIVNLNFNKTLNLRKITLFCIPSRELLRPRPVI